jgi:prepilin-type N-terminal cleavage/methylation domain-containing protein
MNKELIMKEKFKMLQFFRYSGFNLSHPRQGFTLIELLVVISIIGIIISLSFVGFSETRKSARDSKRKADLEQIRSALEMYRNEEKSYPPTAEVVFGEDLSGYMKLPKDPLSSRTYCYNQLSDNEYCLCASLESERPEDSSDCNCGNDCDCFVSSVLGETGPCNYKIKNY